MLDFMVKKVVKDFMIMKNKILSFFLLGLLFACNDDDRNNPVIPDFPVNISINTDLPSYFHLKNLGNFVYLDGGYKGIILMHGFDDSYYAFDRACTYEPDKDCSLIHYDSTNLNFRCGHYPKDTFVQCCASSFSVFGQILSGPTEFPLKQYNIYTQGATIQISN